MALQASFSQVRDMTKRAPRGEYASPGEFTVTMQVGDQGERLNQLAGRAVYVDAIRTVAIVGVILLHAAGRWTIASQEMIQMSPLQSTSWAVVDVYQTLGVIGVPLFLMLTGALLLQPEKKDESLKVFFKKRWARIGVPTLFWGVAYFVWDFLVQHIEFSSRTFVQGILNGPYTQFWYLYVLVGLYLLTPILRKLIGQVDETIMKYFAILWFVGAAVMPFFVLLTSFQLNGNVFTVTGYVGYYVLGAYLVTVRMRRRTISILMILGVALTAIGTYVLAATVGGTDMYFFQQYLSPTIILASVMMFMMFLTVKPPSFQTQIAIPVVSTGNKLIGVISENTFPIFLLHVMVIESIQKGYFGFTINRDVLNPVIEVPLLTAIVFFSCLGIILLLKKVPYVKRVIG